VIVELDEAKFGKRKYNKGAYREGQWVLGGVDRNTEQCFLLPCPGNKRDALTLLPLISRWILPGSVVNTDEWAAYNGLTAATYTHESVNQSIQFVDPSTGVHTHTEEGLWAKNILILHDAIMYFGDFDTLNIFFIINTELQLNDQNLLFAQ
jgi:hypothetical protein